MSNTTETDVANAALDYCGEGSISTLDDTGSKAARTLKRMLPIVRRKCLSKRNWAFAHRTLTLTARSANSGFPLQDGETAFPLPAEMVRFDELVDPHPLNVCWRIGQGPQGQELILDTDEAPTVSLVWDVTNPALWSPGFVDYVAAELGLRANPQLAGDKGQRDRAKADSRDALRDATSANLQTKAIKAHAGTPFTLARRRSGASVLDNGQHPGA